MHGHEPKRIAFCITDLDPGGAERTLVQLVTRLNRGEWSPFVFCLSKAGVLVDLFRQADVPVICLGARHRHDVWIVARLAHELRKVQPAILQTFLFHANIIGRIAGRLAGVKRIVSGIRVAERRGRFPLQLDRWTNWLVDQNICVSRAVADFSIQHAGLKARKILVIPNGVDFERFAGASPADYSEFSIPRGSPTVLFVGRLDSQKNPQLLLRAAELLRRRNDRLHVLFVGDGPLAAELKASVVAQGLEQQVHFAGWRPDVPNLLKAADCLALTSRWEGMPNVVLEAIAAGCPVIATAVEGVEELIRHEETGLLLESETAECLAAGIERVLTQPGFAAAMAHAAQTMVSERFTYDVLVRSYESVYRSLLGEQAIPTRGERG